MEGTTPKEVQYIRDDYGLVLRDSGEIHGRWVRFSRTLVNAKSPKIDPTVMEKFPTKTLASEAFEVHRDFLLGIAFFVSGRLYEFVDYHGALAMKGSFPVLLCCRLFLVVSLYSS